jgi:Immunity protein 51
MDDERRRRIIAALEVLHFRQVRSASRRWTWLKRGQGRVEGTGMDAIQVIDIPGEAWFAITFAADEIADVRERLIRAGHRGTGCCWEALVLTAVEALSDQPPWIDELDFDSEQSAFCVRANRREPLERLAAMLNDLIADPSRLAAAIRQTKRCLGE